MTRARAMVLTSIWQDEEFTALSAPAQWLYLFLLSQPDLNHLGVLPWLPLRWAQSAPGLTQQAVDDLLRPLSEARFVVVDRTNGAVLIRTFMRHDGVIKQPNILRAARAAIPALLSPMIAEALHQELALIDLTGLPESVPKILDEMKVQLKALVAKGSRNPSGNPSGKGLAKASTKGSENPLGDRGKGLGVSGELAVRAGERAPTPARARGTRIPDPFPVTPEMVAWWQERCPHVDPRMETEKFTNYWRAKAGKDATKLDWPATWRNWMMGAAERLPQAASPGQAPVRRSTGAVRAEQAIEAGKRLQARLDAEKGGQP